VILSTALFHASPRSFRHVGFLQPLTQLASVWGREAFLEDDIDERDAMVADFGFPSPACPLHRGN
jgi:hypothetical protein